MSFKPFYISNFDESSGQQNNLESFLIPEKAYTKLENAVCWRGKTVSRPGVQHLARLRRHISKILLAQKYPAANDYTITDIFADASINLRATEPYAEIERGAVGFASITIIANGVFFTDELGTGVLTSVGGSGTVNYVEGTIDLTLDVAPGAPADIWIDVWYYPSLPVMGLPRLERGAINDEISIAFDQKYAYLFNSPKYEELFAGVTWSGSDWQQFWTCNFTKIDMTRILFVTNNNKADGIRYYNQLNPGPPIVPAAWTTFAPLLTAGTTLTTAACLIQFKNRLLAFNTTEKTLGNDKNFPNKVVWSWVGDPTVPGAFNKDIVGNGGYLFASTSEAIVSVAAIRDQLIVKFERSTYRLLFTGNDNLPFVFQKINTDLGCESQFSMITFDKGILSVGDKGICLDDGQGVARIDMKVPNVVFNIKNGDNGITRVSGIREFTSELAYWAYPAAEESDSLKVTFPNKVLVYNYINGTWAVFDDSFTCYGMYQKQQTKTWDEYVEGIWDDQSFIWDSGAEQSLFPDIVAGNQDGFVSVIKTLIDCEPFNGKTLQLFAIEEVLDILRLTIPNHNLRTGQFIKFLDILGGGGINVTDPTVLNFVNATQSPIFMVNRIDKDKIELKYLYNGLWEILIPGSLISWAAPQIIAYTGTFLGGSVCVINKINIVTKQFSPFYDQGSQCRLGYIDLFASKTESGQFTCDLLVDCNTSNSISDTSSNIVSTAPENPTLIPWQVNQDKIWHRIFTNIICQNFTLHLTLSDEQMGSDMKQVALGIKGLNCGEKQFIIHAFAFYLSLNARLVQ
jgi:hypothetical protein